MNEIMDELNDQRQQRIKKLDALREPGVAPYGTRFDVKDRAGQLVGCMARRPRTRWTGKDLLHALPGASSHCGDSARQAFAVLQDGSDRLAGLSQERSSLGDKPIRSAELLDLGDWIGVTGILFRTKTNEFTVEVAHLTFLSKALRPLPEKWHGLTDVETRYRQRYVDLIANPEVHGIFATAQQNHCRHSRFPHRARFS